MRTCISLLFVLVLFSCAPKKVNFEVSNLLCEYLTNPIGIETMSPRLSWKMKTERRGSSQSSYHIMVASDETLLQKNLPDLWDSGIQKSDNSTQIEYKENPCNQA